MTKLDVRIDDIDIKEWLAKSKNKSKLTREALKEKLQREKQKEYDSLNPAKIEVRIHESRP